MLLGFTEGVIHRSYQVLDIEIILKICADLQITGPSILKMPVLGKNVRTALVCGNILNQKQVYGPRVSFKYMSSKADAVRKFRLSYWPIEVVLTYPIIA